MKPHIEQTINDLKTTVAQLNGMIQFLSDFGVGLDDPIFPVEVPVQNISTPLRQPLRPTQRKPNAGHKEPRRPPNNEPDVCAVARLAEPFTAPQLSKATGDTLKRAQNVLFRFKQRGFVTGTGDLGQYRRTSKFPHPAAPPVEKIRPTVTRTDLEKKLQDALKQRDHARENGRDSIVEMFQKEIDQLQAQLT